MAKSHQNTVYFTNKKQIQQNTVLWVAVEFARANTMDQKMANGLTLHVACCTEHTVFYMCSLKTACYQQYQCTLTVHPQP